MHRAVGTVDKSCLSVRGGGARCDEAERTRNGGMVFTSSTFTGAPHLGMLWRATRGGGDDQLVGKMGKKFFRLRDFRWPERLASDKPTAQHSTYESPQSAKGLKREGPKEIRGGLNHRSGGRFCNGRCQRCRGGEERPKGVRGCREI